MFSEECVMSSFEVLMGGSRGRDRGSDPPPPAPPPTHTLKNHQNIGFLAILVRIPENEKATKPAFNVGSSSARHLNANSVIWILS